MEVNHAHSRLDTPTCGLCKRPLHWWNAGPPEVDHQTDPTGFLSVWWSVFTGLRTLDPQYPRVWAYKCNHLTDAALENPGPSDDMLFRGVQQWSKPPRGLEGLQRGHFPNNCIPSPWPSHPWTGLALRDAPTPVALWRLASWQYIHETGRFRSEHLRWWTNYLWPNISWENLLDWVRAPGRTYLFIGPPWRSQSSTGSMTVDSGPRNQRSWIGTPNGRFRIRGDTPMEVWATHPPPSYFRRWQEYALRLAAGGLLVETWSQFLPALSTAAPASRLVYHEEGWEEDGLSRSPNLAWLTWTQVLAAHVVRRGPPGWVIQHLPPAPEHVCPNLPPGQDYRKYRNLVRPVVIPEVDGGERVTGRTISLCQGLWWAVIWHARDRTNSIPPLLLADLMDSVFPEISIKEWLRLGQDLQNNISRLGTHLAGAYRANTLLRATDTRVPNQFWHRLSHPWATLDTTRWAFLRGWTTWLGRYLSLGDRIRLARAARETLPAPSGLASETREADELAYLQALRYFTIPWFTDHNSVPRLTPDFHPFHGWRVGEAANPGPHQLLGTTVGEIAATYGSDTIGSLTSADRNATRDPGNRPVFTTPRKVERNRCLSTHEDNGKVACRRATERQCGGMIHTYDACTPAQTRAYDHLRGHRIGEAAHPGPPLAQWDERDGEPWEAHEPQGPPTPLTDELSSRIPSPGVQWTQKRVCSPFLDVAQWMAQDCPRYKWVTFEWLERSQGQKPPRWIRIADRTGRWQGVLEFPPDSDLPDDGSAKHLWWSARDLRPAPPARMTRKRQPSGAMVLARPMDPPTDTPRLMFGSGLTLAPLRVVASNTPWNTQISCFGAPGSTKGNVFAELCSGAFATMVHAAPQVGLHPQQAWDKDATRAGNAARIEGAHACIFRSWDMTDDTRWRHLSHTDIWGIGIPCQSTSNAGRSGGRRDDRDLFGTLVNMLRHIRPAVVVIEVVPGFWNPRTPHMGILLDEIRTLPYLLEGRELDIEHYLPQKRKRGVLVLTRWDLYRMPRPDAPSIAAVAWPARHPLRPLAYNFLLGADDNRLQDETLHIGSDDLQQLSPYRRHPSWPAHPAFTRILHTLAWTIMKSYARTTAFPYPWMGQIVQNTNGGLRWLHPRELARFQGLPDTFPLPTDRSQACEWVGDALPPLAAGWFLARALYTIHREIPTLKSTEALLYNHWCENYMCSWTTPLPDEDRVWEPQSPTIPPGDTAGRTRAVCPMCDRALPATTRLCNCPGAAECPTELTLRVHTSRSWGDPIPYGFLLHLLPGGWTRWKRRADDVTWSLPGAPCPSSTNIRDWIFTRMAEDGWRCTGSRPHYWTMTDHLWGFRIYLVIILSDEWWPEKPVHPLPGHPGG